MIRVEQLQEHDGELYVVGKYIVINDTDFALTNIDTKPTFINNYTLRFPSAEKPYVVTHIGFFPVTEYKGLVMQLTKPRPIPLGGDLSFPYGSITMEMESGCPILTVNKEKP